MKYKILDTVWWTPRTGTLKPDVIGLVAIESHTDGSWKAYIGTGFGSDDLADAQHIAANGMPFGSKEAACAIFPNLPADKFKY